jgi:hypothetical protein
MLGRSGVIGEAGMCPLGGRIVFSVKPSCPAGMVEACCRVCAVRVATAQWPLLVVPSR